jgi:hypothetical protein
MCVSTPKPTTMPKQLSSKMTILRAWKRLPMYRRKLSVNDCLVLYVCPSFPHIHDFRNFLIVMESAVLHQQESAIDDSLQEPESRADDSRQDVVEQQGEVVATSNDGSRPP